MSETDSQAAGDSQVDENLDSETPQTNCEQLTVLTEPLRRISDYQLIRKIGRGGMGEVYEALHERLKKRVAVKLLPEGRVHDPAILKRFFREMEAAGKLTHPHIIQATDAGEVEGVPYLVMEMIDGSDLGHLVRQFGALPPLAALEVIEQAALGLEHIHHHGLVHRDVKPSNLLMDRQALVKVGDLGLAQLNQPPSQSDDLTSSDLLLGTIDYMAPEQAESPKLVDHRADIYSLGCCLYFLLTGKTVFGPAGRVDRLIAHRTQLPPSLAQNCSIPIPDSIEHLFRMMLEKRPTQRPDSMRDVLVLLSECRHELEAGFVSEEFCGLALGPRRFPPTAGLRDVAAMVYSVTGRRDGPYLKSTMIGSRRRTKRGRQIQWVVAGLAPFFVMLAILVWGNTRPKQNANATNLVTPPAHELSVLPQTTPPAQINAPAEVGMVTTNAGLTEIRAAHSRSIFGLDFSSDGKLLFSAGDDGAARAWDVSSWTSKGEIRDSQKQLMINIVALPGSDRAVAASFSGRAYVWNLRDGKIEHVFDKANGHVESLALAGGNKVVTSGVEDALYLWDASTGSVVNKLSNKYQGGVRALATDPTRKHLVTGNYEGHLSLWNLVDGTQMGSLSVGLSMIAIWSLDWSPDGGRIAIGGIVHGTGDNRGTALLMIYDPFRQEVVKRLEGHGSRVNGVRFSRDGQMLFSVGDDFRAWSLPDGKLVAQQQLVGGELFGLAESVDQKLIAAGSSNGTIYVIDAHRLRKPANAQ